MQLDSTEHTVAGRSLWNLGNPGFYSKPYLKRANGKACAGSFTPVFGIINISLCSGLMGLWHAGFCPQVHSPLFDIPALNLWWCWSNNRKQWWWCEESLSSCFTAMPHCFLESFVLGPAGRPSIHDCCKSCYHLNDRFSLVYYYFWLR